MISVVEHPLVNHNLTVLRASDSSSDIYRSAARRIAYYLAFEVSKNMDFNLPHNKQSGQAGCKHTSDITLIPILRSGLAMLEPFTQIIPHAAVGFAGFIRTEQTQELEEYYFSLPPINENTNIVILEPAIASGDTICATLSRLQFEGAESISVVSIVISEPAAERIRTEFPDVRIVTIAIDAGLDEENNIIPGIGSASDKFFGG